MKLHFSAKILFVVCTFRRDNVIRIISARLATKAEKERYENGDNYYECLPTELTEQELAELESAEHMPITFDEDSPEMTADMLKQFHRMDSVNIKLSPENMKKVKSFGKDYPEILSRLLDLAINDTELLKKCI